MGRPRKQTVDYFPHYCEHGKTMFILEQKYGNDGYAFWFKLLELLGKSEGHHMTLATATDWEFLQAKTHIDRDKCEEILELLASLHAIDGELWQGNRTIWSDNFIANVTDAYKNRRVEIPIRPSFYEQKPPSDGVSTGRNPQMKLDEMKLDETKEDTSPHTKIQHLIITKSEHAKLTEQFGGLAVDKIYESMANYGKLKQYKSGYLTAKKWLERDKPAGNLTPTDSYDDAELILRRMQRAAAGKGRE